LIGEIAEGIVIAFRGTLPLNLHQIPSLRDWLGDFQADTVTSDDFPGAVHQGFRDTWSVLMPRVAAELANQQAAGPSPRPVFVTGHSKGGAVACLAAWTLLKTGTTPSRVVTFAAAKPADADFSKAYNASGIVHARYEYNNDIVPHLPLSDQGFIDALANLPVIGGQYTVLNRFDYQPVGALAYIESNDQIIPDNANLRSKRDLALALEVIQGHFSKIAADHSISCGSGYMTAIAPEGVCRGGGA
jgi:hypothetical protein